MDWETDIKPIVTTTIRNALQPLAGILVAHGAISSDQSTQFVQIGAGIATWVGVYAWSVWQKRHQKAKLVVAAATGVVK